METKKSEARFAEAQKWIPGGVNSPVRAFRTVGIPPRFIDHAVGSKIFDTDGNAYIDYVGSWGPMIVGHSHPNVVKALGEKAARGLSFGAPTALEVELAQKIVEAVPSVEMIRMVNSGTEATMAAIRVARGYTGRDKVIKFEGAYHGHGDYLLVKAGSGATTLGVPDSMGVPADFAKHTLIARFNDLSSVEALADAHPDQVACIILEPVAGNMGVVPPREGFLQGLRKICDVRDIVLIFDEVMTGFRVAYGGAQALFGVTPDALHSKRKDTSVSHPRMLAMWLARKHTRSALSEIGRFFGRRSHSTVVSAKKRVEEWMANDKSVELADRTSPIEEVIRRAELSLLVG